MSLKLHHDVTSMTCFQEIAQAELTSLEKQLEELDNDLNSLDTDAKGLQEI